MRNHNQSKEMEIAVAHYNEDLSWLGDHLDACRIYSKGGDQFAPPYPHQKLPNIGREGHTYLHHIIERYDDLADLTIFLQGRVDDHITISLDEMIDRSTHAPKERQVTTFPFRELERFDHWNGIPWEKYPCWKKWSLMPRRNAAKTPAEYWRQFFPGTDEIPMALGFHPGALFAVRKSAIQQHPRSFYQSMLETFFLHDMAHVNPETGHIMERFWLALWDPAQYVSWHDGDVAKTERNEQGQLAKGKWHVTPMWTEVDERTLPPMVEQYVLFPDIVCRPWSGLNANEMRFVGSLRRPHRTMRM